MHAYAVRLGIGARLESLNLKARGSGHGFRALATGGRSTGSNLLVLDTDSAALSRGVGGHVALILEQSSGLVEGVWIGLQTRTALLVREDCRVRG